MTKIHETFYRKKLGNLGGFNSDLKGEITAVLSKRDSKSKELYDWNEKQLRSDILKYLKRYTLKDVVKLISEKNNLPKNKVYKLCLKVKKK